MKGQGGKYKKNGNDVKRKKKGRKTIIKQSNGGNVCKEKKDIKLKENHYIRG